MSQGCEIGEDMLECYTMRRGSDYYHLGEEDRHEYFRSGIVFVSDFNRVVAHVVCKCTVCMFYSHCYVDVVRRVYGLVPVRYPVAR